MKSGERESFFLCTVAELEINGLLSMGGNNGTFLFENTSDFIFILPLLIIFDIFLLEGLTIQMNLVTNK